MRIALLTTDNREPHKKYTLPEPYFGAAPEALLQGLAAFPEAEVHVISCIRQPVKSPPQLAPNIFFHSLVVPKIGWIRTGYQGCIRATRKKLSEIQPDIVHGQGTELDSGICAAFSSFPNVLTIHGNMQAISRLYHSRIGSFHWLAGKLETLALGHTSGVFCNSSYTESCVAYRTPKTWRVPNALRPAFFDQPRSPRSSGPPIILNVGLVLNYKQQLEILKTARALWHRGLKFEFQFAGERALGTSYGAAFDQLLTEAVNAGYARHLGLLDTRQLIAAMDAAAAMVHFPTEESFGLVVAEALARNLKLFGAATGGVVDIARGVAGAELFPAQDFSSLENALAQWLQAGCAPPQNAAATMRERYHPEVIARRHLEIYREVLHL